MCQLLAHESGLKTPPTLRIIVISGPLPVRLPIQNLPKNNFVAAKDAPRNFRKSPWGEDMDEIDLFGTKVPNKSATVKRIF